MLNLNFWLPFLAFSGVHGKQESTHDASPPPHSPTCDSSTFTPPVLTGAKVLSISATPRHNFTTSSGGPLFAAVSNLNFCEVKVILTHPGVKDKVLVEVWLPLSHDDWNGRFQATGGGGFGTGMFQWMLGPAIRDGYAASSTDGGHHAAFLDLDWGLIHDAKRNKYSVDWNLLQNFATRSLADQVHVGKSITEQFFGRKPHHSYWNGCSTGGRQGHMMAQKYPGLLDGILAIAPAIRMTGLTLTTFWPQIVMIDSGTFLSSCELQWFEKKVLEACDMLDGVRDGVIVDPEACEFDPQTLVGQKIQCDGQEEVEVTEAMADVVRKTHEGPKTPFGAPISHGLSYGASARALGDVTVSPEGVRSPNPFPIASAWIKNFLLKDPSFNISSLTYASYFSLFAQSAQEFSWILDYDGPDISAFRDAGSKLLSWHGTSDPVIPYQNTVQYRERVEREMGGAKAVDEFYRLFLAPGVEHCGLGAGPLPKDPLEKLVEWVEKGEAPKVLDAETKNAEGELVTRELCLWPRKLKYMGIGDAKRASSWSCEGGDEEEGLDDSIGGSRSQKILGGLKERLQGLGLGLKIS